MSHVLSWLLSHVLCFTFHVSSLMPHVPCLTFDIGGMRHAWDMRHEDLRHEAWKNMRHETRDLSSFVSGIMPHASWLMFSVSRLLRYETWPPSLHGGRGVVTGDMRHENMSHEPPGPRHENWSHEKTRCTRHETWDTSYKTRNTRHETRVTRRKPPPPMRHGLYQAGWFGGGGVFMEVLVHFWPFTSWPSSKYSVFIPVHKLVPPPFPTSPPPPTPSFSYLYYIYYRVGKGVGGRGLVVIMLHLTVC